MVNSFITISCLIFYASIQYTLGFQCNGPLVAKCKSEVEKSMAFEIPNLSKLSQMELCKDVRHNMNCLLWYSTHCAHESKRNDIGSLIMTTRGFLVRTCETEDKVNENWIDGPCFRGTSLRNCHNYYIKHNRHQAESNADKCTKYNDFKNCITDEVTKTCQSSNQLFLPSYLIDMTSELSWSCSDSSDSAALPRFERFTYLDNAACVSKITEDSLKCMENYANSIANVEKEIPETAKVNRKMCCSLSKAEYCIRDLVKERCSKEVTIESLLDKFMTEAREKVKTQTGIECSESDHNAPRCCSALASCPSILFLLILFFATKYV